MSAFSVPAVITTICCMMVSTYASSVYGVCRCMRFYQCNRDKGRVAALDVSNAATLPGLCVKSPSTSLGKCQRPLPSVPPTGSFKEVSPCPPSLAFTAVVFSSPCPPLRIQFLSPVLN